MSKDSALTNLELTPSDANVMVRFVGELNENLKFVEKNFNVKIFQNGNNLKIQGSNKDVGLSVPLVVRLEGTNVSEGKSIINESGLNVIAADDLDDAAKKIVRAVKER